MPVRKDPVAAFFAKVAEISADVAERGGGMADIRQKLVEEPWFGRVVTAQREPGMAEKLGWDVPAGPGHPQRAQEHDPAVEREQERDRGIDL